MKTYTCPMHPEVTQHKPGKCPKCGMALVVKSEQKHHPLKSYFPLLVIVTLIALTAFTIGIREGAFDFRTFLTSFMAGFFLVFAGFKLMDLKGFAEGYSTYDLLAKRWFGYGYLYPFIELFFGLSMILIAESRTLLWAEVLVMAFSGLGVAIKLAKREKFQCACLGTFLKVPLTKVTLIEDFGMAFLALVMLFI